MLTDLGLPFPINLGCPPVSHRRLLRRQAKEPLETLKLPTAALRPNPLARAFGSSRACRSSVSLSHTLGGPPRSDAVPPNQPPPSEHRTPNRRCDQPCCSSYITNTSQRTVPDLRGCVWLITVPAMGVHDGGTTTSEVHPHPPHPREASRQTKPHTDCLMDSLLRFPPPAIPAHCRSNPRSPNTIRLGHRSS